MAMIEVEHFRKILEDSKGAKLKGAFAPFIHPEKQTFEAVMIDL